MLLASCAEGNREPSEADLSEFGVYVDSLDAGVEGQWFTRMGMSSDADAMLSYLRTELPRHGLDTAAFCIPEIAECLYVVRQLAFDSLGVSINQVLPRLDSLLSQAYLCYTVGQRYGFVQPDKLLNHLCIKPDSSSYYHLFDYSVKAPDSKEAEQKLMSDDRMDYLRESVPDDNIYRILQAKLENTQDKELRHQLAVNMERCRWQMKRPVGNEPMVLVNIPSLQLWAVSPDSILNMRVVCGAKATKTPLLHSEITYMQVNPEWIIPFNIVRSDIARHGGDSVYFARHRYYIIDRQLGDTLNPLHVTSDQLASGRLRVGQKGGAGNSLGRIVFRFKNNFAVYLHDTNNRGAFNRERRTLSHGCVRVQKPFELACFLLPQADEWDKDKLRISMDLKPETKEGILYLQEHAEDLLPHRLVTHREVTPHVPVYIIYYTAYPNPSTGIVETWPDIYGYDKAISQQMKYLLK